MLHLSRFNYSRLFSLDSFFSLRHKSAIGARELFKFFYSYINNIEEKLKTISCRKVYLINARERRRKKKIIVVSHEMWLSSGIVSAFIWVYYSLPFSSWSSSKVKVFRAYSFSCLINASKVFPLLFSFFLRIRLN